MKPVPGRTGTVLLLLIATTLSMGTTEKIDQKKAPQENVVIKGNEIVIEGGVAKVEKMSIGEMKEVMYSWDHQGYSNNFFRQIIERFYITASPQDIADWEKHLRDDAKRMTEFQEEQEAAQQATREEWRNEEALRLQKQQVALQQKVLTELESK